MVSRRKKTRGVAVARPEACGEGAEDPVGVAGDAAGVDPVGVGAVVKKILLYLYKNHYI